MLSNAFGVEPRPRDRTGNEGPVRVSLLSRQPNRRLKLAPRVGVFDLSSARRSLAAGR